MANQQQQPPNIANLNAAVAGMAAEGNNIIQAAQAYNGHQQQLNIEVSRSIDIPIAQLQQQMNVMQQQIADFRTEMIDFRAETRAANSNVHARMQNARVTHATAALTPLCNIVPDNNPPVLIGQPLPNFPARANDISRMTAIQCRHLLDRLNWPYPGQISVTELRTLVRDAVGLLAL